MQLTTLTYCLLGIILLFIIGGIRKGCKRGMTYSFLSLATIVLSCFFAAMLAVLLSRLFAEQLFTLLTEQGILMLDEELLTVYTGVFLLILRMAMALLLYLPIFGILRLLFAIPFRILCHSLEKNKKNAPPRYHKEGEELYVRRHHRIGGAIGAFSGFLVAVIVLSPLTGLLKTADAAIDVYDTLLMQMEKAENGEEGTEDKPEEEENEIIAGIHLYATDIGITVVDTLGGAMLFHLTTSLEEYGERTDLVREINVIRNTDLSGIETLLKTLGDPKSMDMSGAATLIDSLTESMVIKLLLVESLRGAATAWLDDEEYLGQACPVFAEHEAIDGFTDEILYVCTSTSYYTVEEDLRTLFSLGNILTTALSTLDLENYESLIDELIENGLLTRLREELVKNPHMMSVAHAIDDLVMTVVSDELQNTLKYTDEQRDVLFDELADILTSTIGSTGSVRQTAVTQQIKESLEVYGVYIPDALNDTIASQLISGIEDDGSPVTREEIADFFDTFMAGNITDFIPGGDISGILP